MLFRTGCYIYDILSKVNVYFCAYLYKYTRGAEMLEGYLVVKSREKLYTNLCPETPQQRGTTFRNVQV